MISQQVANSTYNWSVGLILERTKKYWYLFYQLLFFETLCILTIERGGKNSIAIIFLCFRDWSSTYQQGHISKFLKTQMIFKSDLVTFLQFGIFEGKFVYCTIQTVLLSFMINRYFLT